jgi:hypothetical protein
MMFIVRGRGQRPSEPGLRVALVRRTPSLVATEAGQVDLFCLADEAVAERLREQGWNVVNLRDGWYQADDEGGVAIWGQGLYWELRDTPLSVREAAGPGGEAPGKRDGDDRVLDVRGQIFGT